MGLNSPRGLDRMSQCLLVLVLGIQRVKSTDHRGQFQEEVFHYKGLQRKQEREQSPVRAGVSWDGELSNC